jgi:C_GCAxxG_C_C family probable redox protein
MLLVVGEHVLGHLPPESARMATGLAGGIGGSHEEVCGALSGGVLVIGGAYGRTELHEDDQMALTLSMRFRERFLAQLGHTQCAQLRTMVHAPGGPDSCAQLVQQAALILLQLLDESQQNEQG